MSKYYLRANKKIQNRFITATITFPDERVEYDIQSSPRKLANVFDDLISKIYSLSSLDPASVFKIMLEDEEANSYITTYLNELVAHKIQRFSNEYEIESFNSKYVSDFLTYYIPESATVVDDDNPFNHTAEDEYSFEISDEVEIDQPDFQLESSITPIDDYIERRDKFLSIHNECKQAEIEKRILLKKLEIKELELELLYKELDGI